MSYAVMNSLTGYVNEKQAVNKKKKESHLQVLSFPIQEIRIEEFPVWYFSGVDASTDEIANLLDILIQERLERTNHESDQVLLPSVIELSLYFQCPEIQIHDALDHLRRWMYRVFCEESYSKIYVKERKLPDTVSSEEFYDDGIDWRDITHDFMSDVITPIKNRLRQMLA